MPRPKKQHLKQRADGRYACRYRDQWFYGLTEGEALEAAGVRRQDRGRQDRAFNAAGGDHGQRDRQRALPDA